MERTLALQNALGTLCYINTLHPELLSTFSNYKCVYYVEVQVNPNDFNVYELMKALKPGLMQGVEIAIDYNEIINRNILRIGWRHFEEEKKWGSESKSNGKVLERTAPKPSTATQLHGVIVGGWKNTEFLTL